MSERSVAEIIGWKVTPERKNDDGSTTMCSWWRPDAPLQRFFGRKPEPTVDDLLAWLREQVASEVEPGCGDAIEMYWDPEHPDMCSVCIGIGQWDAPTLLAALELTVRAMAGES